MYIFTELYHKGLHAYFSVLFQSTSTIHTHTYILFKRAKCPLLKWIHPIDPPSDLLTYVEPKLAAICSTPALASIPVVNG